MAFMTLALVLLTIGVVMVLSASFARAYYDLERETGGRPLYYFVRQLCFALMGTAAMAVCSRIPAGVYRRLSGPLFIASVLLLAAVPVIGTTANGAKRWISLGFTTFQPSEIAKIGVVLLFADMIVRRGRQKMGRFRTGIVPFAALLVLVVGLLLLEPHISASLIIILIGAVMLFLGGARLGWFIAGAGAVAGAGLVVVTRFAHASSRISRTRSRTAAARRSMRPSTRSRMWTATSSKTLSTSRRISFCDIRSWSVHVSTIDAANAIATAPTRRQARRRCPSVLMVRSFPRWPRPARP